MTSKEQLKKLLAGYAQVKRDGFAVDSLEKISDLRKRYLDLFVATEEFVSKNSIKLADKSFFINDSVVAGMRREINEQTPREIIERILSDIAASADKDIAVLGNLNISDGPMVIVLETDGRLYRKDNREMCYPMEENSDRYKIVRMIASEEDFLNTSEIARQLDKSASVVRKEIGEINNNFKKFLQNDADLFESKKGSGYKIAGLFKLEIADG